MQEESRKNIHNELDNYIQNTYQLGSNSGKDIAMMQDIQLLASALVDWIEQRDPKFIFKDFFDPVFTKKIRLLIKNPTLFNCFLASISFSYIDFFHNAVYLIPHVFTSHLITFIREKYQNLSSDIPLVVDKSNLKPSLKKYLDSKNK